MCSQIGKIPKLFSSQTVPNSVISVSIYANNLKRVHVCVLLQVVLAAKAVYGLREDDPISGPIVIVKLTSPDTQGSRTVKDMEFVSNTHILTKGGVSISRDNMYMVIY